MNTIKIDGKYNLSKGLVLKLLLNLKALRPHDAFTIEQLCRKTGVPQNYLKDRLGVWQEWGLVKSRKGEVVVEYTRHGKKITANCERIKWRICTSGVRWLVKLKNNDPVAYTRLQVILNNRQGNSFNIRQLFSEPF